MPEVNLDMDVLALLRLEARKDGDDLSACIRRLILNTRTKKAGKRMTVGDLRIPGKLTPETLASDYPTAILRFMCALGWLHQKHGADFAMVQHYTGRGRTYFAKNAQIILDGGNSTKPQRIPESDFWVCTNLSNKVKGQILEGVMTILGYAASDRKPWVEAVEGEELGGSPPSYDLAEADDEDDDGDVIQI